jgi:hypothetical protein
MTRKRLLWAGVGLAALIVIVLVLALAPFGLNMMNRSKTGPDDPVPIATADLGGSRPGSVLSATTMPAFARTAVGSSMRSARVVYRSSSDDTGNATVVSGTVFTPLGEPPEGGWPVISFGHGTLGIDKECAPSLSATLLGLAPVVDSFIKNHYSVALADYQGLGSDGIHPYLDSRTAGLNMIDAVRALRHTFDRVSNQWGAFGGSQGGGAAWAADEQAATYAPELKLVGAVAISPAADVTGLVDKAQAGTLTKDQGRIMQSILESLSRLHPDLNRDDFRQGAAARYWDVLTACSGPEVHLRTDAVNALAPTDFSPRTPAVADRLRQLLAQWALPQRPLSAPLFVDYGGNDTYIDPGWTTAAIARACALGGTIRWKEEPGKGHGDVDLSEGVGWMDDRFSGVPITNQCNGQ